MFYDRSTPLLTTDLRYGALLVEFQQQGSEFLEANKRNIWECAAGTRLKSRAPGGALMLVRVSLSVAVRACIGRNTANVCAAWPVRRQTYGHHLPSLRRCQIILLGSRGTCVCKRVAWGHCSAAGSRNRRPVGRVSRASPHDDVTELQRLLFSETKLWTFAPRPFYYVIRGVIRVVGPSNSATRVVHPCRCKQGQEKKTRVL